jgi:Domain of unknown function (DUF4145)
VFDTFKRMRELGSRKRLQCNVCRRQTIHTLEAQCKGEWEDYNLHDMMYGWTDFSLYRCGACDEVCYEKVEYFSELADHDIEGKPYFIPTEAQYPPPSSADLAFDTDFTPRKLNELIEEMLYALAGSKLNLATVALRMLVEFITTDTKCAGRSLEKKIDDLLDKGLVDADQLALLHTIRRKGNAGAHKFIAMNRKEMVAGIGVINLLLEKLYNGPRRQEEVLKKAQQAFNH